MDDSPSLDLSDYELRWPAELFASEGSRVLRTTGHSWEDRAKWLLTEAFTGTTAVTDFEEVPRHRDLANDPWAATAGGWGTPQQTGRDQRDWLKELIRRASELRYATAPRPYWPQRYGSDPSPNGRTARDARQDFARLISEFADNGYLAEKFGEHCVDRHDDLPDASKVIEARLGIADLWPLAPETWDENTFYGLIEVLHDLVSRPRTRQPHSFNDCGWHHFEFHSGPARVLYRWKVNHLLREAGIEYELAAEGEDLGRLVAITDDARSQLVHRALNDSPPDVIAEIRHAIALFRGRDTSVEFKRSAIFNLGRILEDRRALLKDHLLKKDEGALFQIANGFDLRHRNAAQQDEYDEAFLDWIFWWYLATLELTNRLIASRTAG
ncbi:hypothetical protein [Streptomyces brevispora]|uniref:hypothetical protein n=1 Tax=Streptomyces brevispora TaxID=887462 RepID=UPI0035E0D79B